MTVSIALLLVESEKVLGAFTVFPLKACIINGDSTDRLIHYKAWEYTEREVIKVLFTGLI